MSDVQPLIALLEMMLNLSTPMKPSVKPGGYSEDIFFQLSEEEKEEFECSICYQILKDPRMCINQHRFCYTCIFVWSTNGHSENHGRCPVCRAQGYYTKCRELGEKIDRKLVKCHIQSCKWKGQLKHYNSHQHTTYTKTGLPYRPSNREEETNRPDDLPSIPPPDHRIADSNNRTPLPVPTRRAVLRLAEREPTSQRLLQRNDTRTPAAPRTNASTTRASNNVTENDASSSGETVSNTQSPRTPRPPSVPRPQGLAVRRRPTLPNILSESQTSRPNAAANSSTSETRNTATRAHVGGNSSTSDLRNTSTNMYRRAPQNTQNATPVVQNSIRDRLRESRNRLDTLMTSFSSELDRGRREITEFQEQRERRRQEQLEEVRELGSRLGTVATELRRLLEQRRQLRDALPDTMGNL